MTATRLRQLVLNARTRELSAVPNPSAKDALEFEDSSHLAPRLGTPALCQLASHAGEWHHDLTGVEIRDRWMNALPPESEVDLQARIRAALADHDLVSVKQLLRTEYGMMLVVEVTLAHQQTGEQVRVGRMGSLTARSTDVMDKFIKPAFRELQLS